jgi:PAS domain S-box-containing protein
MNNCILIVEDDMIVANNLQDRLKGLGHTVCGLATSGEEALVKVAESRPDLVLMDIKLRGTMDGVSSAVEIRSRYDIPVVYLTGYADDSTLARAKVSEPYGYILKPFEVGDLHTTIEIALHKHAIEKRLRESEQKYRNLVEHSLQGIMVIQGVPPRVLFANRPCAEISGYSIDELTALPPEDTLVLVHPQDRAWLVERLGTQLAGNDVPSTAEFRVVRSDGGLRWVEYSASLIMLDGTSAIQVAFVDITERKEAEEALRRAHSELERRVKERTAELADANRLLTEEVLTRQDIEQTLQLRNRELQALHQELQQHATQLEERVGQLRQAEKALRESEARFRNLFDGAPLCIFELDLSRKPHTIVQANQRAEEVYGWPRAELVSMPLPQLISGDSLDHDRLFGALLTGETSTLESLHRRRDGSVFPVRASAAPASITDPQRIIFAVEDITAEKSRRSEEEAIAEERRRMAREIHDGLAQNLASLRLRARLWHNIIDQNPDQMHAEVDAVRALLGEQIQDVRRSIFALRPVPLDQLGFFPALRQFIRDFGEQNQLHTDLHIVGSEERLPSRLEPVLFRIVQEGLNNVSKHAQASTVWIELDLDQAASLILVMRDDGIGFDPKQLARAARLGHLGLRQMQERVEELGGQFLLQVRPEKGTEIRVVLPAPYVPGGG